jgi:hypothetical protein
MTNTPQTTALNPLGTDFDRFLYSQVGEDHHGDLLSVVSALARVGVDPWEQAAILARLPVASAARMLAALLAKLPAGPGAPVDSLALATHLVTLLPRVRRVSAAVPAGATRVLTRISNQGGWPIALLHAAGLLGLLVAMLLLLRG